MVGRQDSWTKDYTEVVDFEVPLLAAPPTPSPSLPSISFAQAQGQARAQVPQSMSQPTRLSPPAAAASGHPHPQPPHPHDQSTTHHNDDNAHHNPASFARHANHSSFKSLPSSPLNPASPPHQHHQNHHGMASPSIPAGHNGASHPPTPFGSNAPRPGSRGSQTFPSPPSAPNFSRMANEELRALNAASTAGPYPSNLTSQGLTGGSRGSMILYRRADSFVGTPILAGEDGGQQLHFLPPPPVMGGSGFGGGGSNRGSMYSVSGDSIVSMATGPGGLGDSKYPPSLFSGGASTPGGALSPPTPGHRGTMYDNRASYFTDNRTSMALSTFGGGGGLVAYAYDPDEDDDSDDDEDDWLHDPEVAYPGSSPSKLKSANRKSTASSKAQSDAPITGGSDGVTPSASSNGGHSSTTTTSDLKAAKQAGVAVPTGTLRQPDPSKIPPNFHGMSSWSWRGLINIATLVGVITALLCLFAVYPIVRMGMDEGVAKRITGNTRINATGQAVEDGFGGDDADTTSTGTRARPTATELNPQGGGTTFDRRELPVARAEPLPSFPAPTYAPVGQVPILEEYESEETQGIVRMERICVPANHGVEVEVGYSVGKEKGKAFWFNGEWRLHHQYLDDQLDRKSRPTMMLLGAKTPFANTKDQEDVTVSLVVGLPPEKEHARLRYVKFHLRPLSNSRVIGGRLKYKYGSKAKLDLCDLSKTTRVDLELEMGDVISRIAKGADWS